MLELKTKYLFKGTLELKTALHIGGGKESFMSTDSPVVRTPEGDPFIPGSSFKGAFRSTVEKLAISIPTIKTCQLIESKAEEDWKGKPTKEICKLVESSDVCPTSIPKMFAQWKEDKSEDVLNKMLKQKLCHTCSLFGSPYSASKIFFHDLKLEEWAGVTQIRDGVGIDRDSERAKDQLKYDFEVVPPTSTFIMEIVLENPSTTDLGLTCLGLNEFLSEMGYIGGMTSRGLGNCKITNLDIYCLDLVNEGKEERLKNYLLNTQLDKKMEKIPNPAQFIQERIENLFKRDA